MSKQLGIWLDFRKAEIFENQKKIGSDAVTVLSNVEELSTGGGSRSNVPYGPMDVHSDKKILERRKNQFQSFFKRLAKQINDADEIVVFGPGETKMNFGVYLNGLHSFKPSVLRYITKDQMTLNQKRAFVNDFFSE